MRTTVTVDDELLRRAKQEAAATGRSLSSVIEDALRAALSHRSASAAESVRLPTFSGRLRPGIDLDDSAHLLDLMDATD